MRSAPIVIDHSPKVGTLFVHTRQPSADRRRRVNRLCNGPNTNGCERSAAMDRPDQFPAGTADSFARTIL
jgi:hypothetical protein